MPAAGTLVWLYLEVECLHVQLALLNPSWTGPKSSAWNPCGEAGDTETQSLWGVEKETAAYTKEW